MFLRHSFSQSLELSNSATLVGHWAPKVLLSWLPLCWGYRPVPLCWVFSCVLGSHDWSWVCLLVWQVIFPASCLDILMLRKHLCFTPQLAKSFLLYWVFFFPSFTESYWAQDLMHASKHVPYHWAVRVPGTFTFYFTMVSYPIVKAGVEFTV